MYLLYDLILYLFMASNVLFDKTKPFYMLLHISNALQDNDNQIFNSKCKL
jgi:hypothetical protein